MIETLIHFIPVGTSTPLLKKYSTAIPRTGDEIRLGGEGKEQYYKVTLVVWVYDEPECPAPRVNIGIELDEQLSK